MIEKQHEGRRVWAATYHDALLSGVLLESMRHNSTVGGNRIIAGRIRDDSEITHVVPAEVLFLTREEAVTCLRERLSARIDEGLRLVEHNRRLLASIV